MFIDVNVEKEMSVISEFFKHYSEGVYPAYVRVITPEAIGLTPDSYADPAKICKILADLNRLKEQIRESESDRQLALMAEMFDERQWAC